MEQFAPQVFESHAQRMVQLDMDIGETPLVRRFHVPGTPTFVLLDPAGKEVTRFFYEGNITNLEKRLVKFVGEPAALPPAPALTPRERGGPR